MDERVRVRSSSRQRFVQELAARDHRWLADKPRGAGGDDLGPSPVELLLGSFAARTAVGVLELAREKEWAVDSVEVEVSQAATGGAGEPAAELSGAEVSREIVVRGELNDAEKRELEAEVARRWPRQEWLPGGDLQDRFSYE